MLVERDLLLGELESAVTDAMRGHGRLLFIGGEAGVGKSSLVRALADRVADRCVVRIGRADNVTTADAFAPFREAVPEIVPRLAAGSDRISLLRALRETLQATPGLLVLEDLHWADEATFDALRFVSRRLDGVPVLIVVTYRHDEVAPRHPMALLMGELASVSDVGRMLVPPLTTEGVAALVAQTQASVDPAVLHARTGGNPFFVTELLATSEETLPATIGDAVSARMARLSSTAQDVAAAAAVLGTAADANLLCAVSGADAAAIDACVDAGVLVFDGGGFGFRHELARQAVERSLSAVRRRQLHGRALVALTSSTPEDHRTLAHHAEGCGDDAAAASHAMLAAQRAARLGAHREAAEHYRTALRHGTAGADRAASFVALSYECYLTDQLPEAITARQRALELHEVIGARLRVGDDERWLSRLSWFLGRGADAERYAARAIESLQPLPPGAELAMAYSNVAQLRMLAADSDEAVRWGEKAFALAAQLGEVETEAHALNNIGAAMIGSGRTAEGEAKLRRSLDLALGADLHEHAARAYTNLGSRAVEERRYGAALGYLDDGIRYCEDRDLDSWARYMGAWRCVVVGDLGMFDDALEHAVLLLAHPDIAPVSAIPAATAAARVLSRRGEDASTFLGHARALAQNTGELQRIAPVACAEAEDAWLRGEATSIASLTQAAWTLAVSHADPRAAGELGWWRMLGGIPAPSDVPVSGPFAALLSGDAESAAEMWDAFGSPVWSAYARALAADEASADHAVRLLDGLGAAQAVHALLRERRDRGLSLPRRPHPSSRVRPGQLTARELDVLRLLADGLSTADIAASLVVSPRTVEHHISALLHKLGEPTRARAVATALRSGVLER